MAWCILLACALDRGASLPGSDSAPVEGVGSGDPGRAPDDALAALFDPAVLHAVRLELSAASRAALAVPEAEVDVIVDLDDGALRRPARLSVRGGTWGGAVRLRVRLDAERAIGALRRLVLDPQARDPARLRAPLASWILADAGVPAPRVVLARVFDGAESLGVHALAEEVDGAFAVRRGWPAAGAWSADEGVDLVPEAVPAWERVGGGVAEGEAPSAPEDEDRDALRAFADACVDAETPLRDGLSRMLPGWWRTWAWQIALADAGASPRLPEDLNLLEDAATHALTPVPTDLTGAWDPDADARVARTQFGARCLREEPCRDGLASEVRRVLERWDEPAVLRRLEALSALDAAARAAQDAEGAAGVAEARAQLRATVRDTPDRVRSQTRGW
ncbi:MAG: CotH kinase protein [Pseudomonadota bacterium]|jgi:hypothetical protein